MAGETSLRGLLRDLSEQDGGRLIDALERLTDFLRSSTPKPTDAAMLGRLLLELADHGDAEIRKAVVNAARHLRHSAAEAVATRLENDPNHFVRETARLALTVGADAPDIIEGQHETMLRSLAGEIRGRHGPWASREAQRIARRYAEWLVREARHDIVKVFTPLGLHLTAIERELRKAVPTKSVVRRHLKGARKNSRLLRAFVDDLEVYARETEPVRTEAILSKIVDDAVRLALNCIEFKAGGFRALGNIPVRIRVRASHPDLVKAISNLVKNAFESYDRGSKARRTVWVTARHDRRDHTVELRIRDRGVGMNRDGLGAAFDLFGSSKPGGTGCGLPIAKKIIERWHDGTLELETAEGEGTTAVVTLPTIIEERD